MIRYRKTISIGILMIIIATAFSTNVFAGGFDGCCVPRRSECPPINGINNALDSYDPIVFEQPIDPVVSFSFNMEKGELVIKGKGEIRNFSLRRSFPWDSYKNKIKHIKIEKGVTSIGNNAFVDCKYVTDIEIQDGVIEIGNNAFSGCKNLTEITIPASVTEIGRHAFADCTGLKSLTYLGHSDLDREDAFYDCPRLKKVTVLSTYRENIFCGKEAYKGYADLDKCDTDTSKIISK